MLYFSFPNLSTGKQTSTKEAYADIHYVYCFCDGNADASLREYDIRFQNRRLQDAQVFID